MNAVYIRLAVYGLTTAAAIIAQYWGGWGVAFDSATHVLTIDLDAFGRAIVGATLANIAVFKKWGVK